VAEANSVTSVSVEDGIAVVTVNSPPVNALSARVRDGLKASFEQVHADPTTKVIVLLCEGRTFFAGADISEFGKPPQGAPLTEVLRLIEEGAKPVVAAIHGTALGGGFEVALACDYRVAVPSAKVGLPEVKLGIIPGAGGTQRLTRIVGPERALEMITSGEQVRAEAAHKAGALDEIVEEGRLRDGAIAFARRILAEGGRRKRVRDLEDKVAGARGRPEIFDEFRRANARKFRGFEAPEACIQAIEAAVTLPFDEGIGASANCSRSLCRARSPRRNATCSSPSARRARSPTFPKGRRRGPSAPSASSGPAPWAAASP
jgi:3-hydroxyacyl-CoA dehydrogenase